MTTGDYEAAAVLRGDAQQAFIVQKYFVPLLQCWVVVCKSSEIYQLLLKQVEEWSNQGLESSDIGAKLTFQVPVVFIQFRPIGKIVKFAGYIFIWNKLGPIKKVKFTAAF